MKISYEWIREYAPTKVRAANLAQMLTMCGQEVTAIEQKGDDFIFDIEVTSNRPDCLCHIGIAREVAAITGKKLKLPAYNIKSCFGKKIPKPQVIVKDANACPRYTARLIAGVEVAPSPKWLIKKIESIGLRPVNNIVDITNFILFETGHPLHAFDYDKLGGKSVIVRMAKDGEEITTIDNVKRKLKPHTLVIADLQRPVAIAGVMGGANTEISQNTKNILLESAYFDPVSIRRTSRQLGLSTDSSYRFERGVDLVNVAQASDRAASMICAIAKGKTHKTPVDIGKKTLKAPVINLRPQRVNSVLGAKISNQAIKKSLAAVGFKVSDAKSAMKVIAPSFRIADVKREEDLIEEIARIWGYEFIPVVLPRAIITDEESAFKRKKGIISSTQETLAALGFTEILTYSLISKDDIGKTAIPQINVIPIQNPLSDQQAVMRNSLLPGMLKAIAYNINRGNSNLSLFEFSNIYFRHAENLSEQLSLIMGACGETEGDWKRQRQERDLFYLRGVLKTLFETMAVNIYFEETQHPSFELGKTLAIMSGSEMLGTVGAISPQVLAAMDIKQKVFCAEINTQILFKNARLEKYYKPIIKFPGAQRDISACVDNGIAFEDIYRAVKQAGGHIIKDIELVEEYKGKQIQGSQRALLLRIAYQAKERTLTEQEIERAHNGIREKLKKEFNAQLR
ncbi:MAG: phenylalanine--tRNA ligase subunit beta [Candidatus Omnitrophota bacterium]